MGAYGASSSAAGTSVGDRSATVPAMVGMVRIDACNWWIKQNYSWPRIFGFELNSICIVILVDGAFSYDWI